MKVRILHMKTVCDQQTQSVSGLLVAVVAEPKIEYEFYNNQINNLNGDRAR